eukprot:scaffold114_cov361-Pinguiococcus_pyrenoidosus.AAC.31
MRCPASTTERRGLQRSDPGRRAVSSCRVPPLAPGALRACETAACIRTSLEVAAKAKPLEEKEAQAWVPPVARLASRVTPSHAILTCGADACFATQSSLVVDSSPFKARRVRSSSTRFCRTSRLGVVCPEAFNCAQDVVRALPPFLRASPSPPAPQKKTKKKQKKEVGPYLRVPSFRPRLVQITSHPLAEVYASFGGVHPERETEMPRR